MSLKIEKPQEKPIIPIHIREAKAEDVAFLFNSWLESFRNGLVCKGVDHTIYYDQQHKLIEKLFKICTVKIACDEKDPANIFGYLVYQKIDGITVLHYAYTKHTFRKLGVQRELLKTIDHDFKTGAGLYTHATKIAEKLSFKYNLVYHPYILINYIS